MVEIFDSAVRSAGDLAGVFEYDGETGYFYLYATDEAAGEKVLDSIHVLSTDPDFVEADVAVCWDSKEQKVGLFIRGVLWAAFDCHLGTKCGGGYEPGIKPSLPPGAEMGFQPN